jgi:hypothetical protein
MTTPLTQKEHRAFLAAAQYLNATCLQIMNNVEIHRLLPGVSSIVRNPSPGFPLLPADHRIANWRL